MFIVAGGGQTYARLRLNAGPSDELLLAVEIDFQEAQRRILRACQNAGVVAGYGSLFLEDVVDAREQGLRFLVDTADLWIHQRALRDGLEGIRVGK